jgi:hypothetical protein
MDGRAEEWRPLFESFSLTADESSLKVLVEQVSRWTYSGLLDQKYCKWYCYYH